MTAKPPFRLAVVNSHPIQYFAPLYAYLNRDPGIEVTALYCTDYSLRGAIDPGFKQQVKWDVDLLSGYRHVFLGERAKKRSITGFWALVCPEVWHEIRSGKYDAVWLHGYAYAAYVLAFLAAKSRRLPVFVRSETHLGLKRSSWRQRLRDGILRRAYRHVDGFLAIGSANREYYRSLGVPDSKIFAVPYTVDNDRFIAAASITPAQRQQVRTKFGLRDDQPVVLYASKFMRRKHPDDVVAAVSRLQAEGVKVSLLMVGTGEMEAELRAQATRLGVNDVVFGGFVNQVELPQVYAASDIFVLPSESEPWGLIVNEVMCASLPVVVSDEVGCVPDLVHDHINGRLMRAGDVDSLTAALRDLLGDPQRMESAGRQSLETIRNWSYAQCLQGARSAIQHVQAAA